MDLTAASAVLADAAVGETFVVIAVFAVVVGVIAFLVHMVTSSALSRGR